MECSQSQSSLFRGALNFERRYLRRVVKVYNVSNPAISWNVCRLGAEKESRRSEWQIREVRRSRFPGGWPVSSMHFISYDMRRGEQERGDFTTLRSRAIVRYTSSFSLVRGSVPPISKSSPAFNETPLGVYFYDASKIRVTWASERVEQVRRRTVTIVGRKLQKATITNEEFLFFYVCFLSTHLAFSPSAFFFFHAKAPRLISRARMTLRGQVVGDSEVLPAESLLVHGMYSA